MPRKSGLGSSSHRSKGLGRGLEALGLDGALGGEMKEGKGITEVETGRISPNPHQPRRTFAEDALTTLAESIRQYGIVQPLVVRKKEDGYELIAGERRLRAAKLAGLHTVPVIVKEYTQNLASEIALVENLQREDLDAIEEAIAYKRLMNEFSLTQEEVAHKVGRSRSHVGNTMRLLQLAPAIQDDIIAGELSPGQARPLIAISDPERQVELAAYIKEEELSVRDVETLVRKMQAKWEKEKKVTTVEVLYQREVREIVVADIEDRLKQRLGAKVSIKMNDAGSKGKIEIPFTSAEEFERILALIEEEPEAQEPTPVIQKFTI